MRDEPALHSGEVSEKAGVTHGAVAPADFRRVFFIRVLRLVNEDIRPGAEVEQRQIRHYDCAFPGDVVEWIKVPFKELVIGNPDDLFPFDFDLVAKGDAGVIDGDPRDFKTFDLEGLFVEVVEAKVRPHVLHLDREVFAVGPQRSKPLVCLPFEIGFKIGD